MSSRDLEMDVSQNNHQIETIEEVDSAIVGGGVAGCYVGYRLTEDHLRARLKSNSPLLPFLQDRGKLKIGLYECSARLGGRLSSVRLPEAPSICGELGGMRFHEQIHIIMDLLAHLKLDSLVTNFWFDEKNNYVYVRATHLRHGQLTTEYLKNNQTRLPYNLRAEERGQSASDLITFVTNFAVPGFSEFRNEYHIAFKKQEWHKVEDLSNRYEQCKYTAKVNGQYLYKMTWWNLLSIALSQEAIHFIQDTGGYECLASSGSATHILDEIFYTPQDVRHKMLAGGFEQLPKTLHRHFEAAGGKTLLLHQLLRFDKVKQGDGQTVYDLLFYRRPSSLAKLTERETSINPNSGSYIRVKAKFLVLALPKRALELLDRDNFFFQDETLQKNLQSTVAVKAIKIFLAYHYPWWEKVGVSRGRSTTDLPIRQVYYWGVKKTIEDCKSNETRDRPCLLMACYTNGSDVDYWRSLQEGELYLSSNSCSASASKETDRSHSNCCGLFEGGDVPSPPIATRQMVERIHAMLMEVHGVKDAPLPCCAYYQDWSDDPYGGGWHVWKENYDPDLVIPYMRQPFPQENVYIVSECWSNEPGSVQGSLKTAECMLQDCLGLKWPEWLRHSGTRLGPRSPT